MTSQLCQQVGDEQTFLQADNGLAETWPGQLDLRQQLRADIQEGFDKLSAELVQEMRSLLRPRGPESPFESEPVEEQSPFESEQVYSTDSDGNELVINTLVDSGDDEGMSPTLTRNTDNSALTSKFKKTFSRLTSHIYKDVIIQEGSLQTWMSDIVHNKVKALHSLEKESMSLIEHFVLSWQFTCISFAMIVANAFWMSYESDQQFRMLMDPEHNDPHLKSVLYSVSLVFAIFFMVELILKLGVLRSLFFIGEDWKWNCYDFVLVASSIPELFDINSNITFLRLLRILKITKAMRLMRVVKFLVSLREIMFSFMQTLGALFWSFVAIALVSYMFSLLFMQATSILLESNATPDDLILESFSGTGNAMLTLFTLISGGQDWYPVQQGFTGAHYVAAICRATLAFYVFFMLFGLVNVIIGVFCARAADAVSSDEDLSIAKEESRYKSIISQTIKIFHEMDLTGSGCITKRQFREYVKTSKSLALRGMPGFPCLQFFDVRELWRVMLSSSHTRDGTVDVSGFVMAVLRFSGEAKSAEAVMMALDVKDIQKKVSQLTRSSRFYSVPLSPLQRQTSRQTQNPKVVTFDDEASPQIQNPKVIACL